MNTEQQQHSIFLGTRQRSTPVTSQQENRWMYAPTENVKIFNIFRARYLANEDELSNQTSYLNYSQWGLSFEVCLFVSCVEFPFKLF